MPHLSSFSALDLVVTLPGCCGYSLTPVLAAPGMGLAADASRADVDGMVATASTRDSSTWTFLQNVDAIAQRDEALFCSEL